MKCSYCGAEFEGNFCQECGAKAETQSSATPPPIQQPTSQQQRIVPPDNGNVNAYQKLKKPKKPFYKKWWLYVVAAVALITIISVVSGGSKSVKIDWDEMILGSQLPEPPASKGEIHENSSNELWVEIKNITDKQYNDYVEACKNKSFTVDAEAKSSSYDAYNTEGYKLSLSHYDSKGELSIKLEKPMEMSTITWPTSKAGSQLPVPKSTTGKFSYERDDSFFVYVGDTSKADYDQYVADCSAYGFNVDYDKGDTYYRADNADGYHISLKYEGNKIMTVEIIVSKTSDTNISEPTTTKSSADSTKPSESVSSETKPTDNNLVDGMRKDFKDAMDSYETFMDEYVAFMKKYSDNPSDVGLLADYTKYMSKYADMVDKFDKWESEDLNDAELAYYIDVQARVSKKLLEVAN